MIFQLPLKNIEKTIRRIGVIITIAIGNGKNSEDKPEPHSFNFNFLICHSDYISIEYDQDPWTSLVIIGMNQIKWQHLIWSADRDSTVVSALESVIIDAIVTVHVAPTIIMKMCVLNLTQKLKEWLIRFTLNLFIFHSQHKN